MWGSRLLVSAQLVLFVLMAAGTCALLKTWVTVLAVLRRAGRPGVSLE